MNYLLEIYRKMVPENIRRTYNEIFQEFKFACINRQSMEKRRYGNLNKDKTFYVIRTDSTQHWGIATTCIMVLNNIKYAVDRGWIPIVDYKNYYLVNLQNEENRGKQNAWEYYFEQLCTDVSLEEVYKSRKVILGPLWGQPCGSLSWNDTRDIYDAKREPYFELFSKYIRINPELLASAKEVYNKIFACTGNKPVLAVSMRAEFYWGMMVNSSSQEYQLKGDMMKKNAQVLLKHPKELCIEAYIELVYEYMDKFHCEYLFVSSDDRYYLERMKSEFGEKCLYYNRTLPHFFDNEGLPLLSLEDIWEEMRTEKAQKRGIDYFVEIYLVSQCDSLLCGKGGVATMASLIKNKKYNNYYIHTV